MRIAPQADLAPKARDRLVDLWVRAWTPAMPTIDFEDRRGWFAARLDELMAAGAALLVAERDDGTPCGFLTLALSGGEIDQIAVDPDHAGAGLGGRLIEAAKALSPDGLHLSVNAGNARARRLYARAGFTVTGEGVNPRSGLPVLTMAWRPRARGGGSDPR